MERTWWENVTVHIFSKPKQFCKFGITKTCLMSYHVNVVFIKDENGYYAHCPELPGCHSQGVTYEEARGNIKEALELYLETMNKAEIDEALNKELLTTTMEVEVG